MPTSSLWETTFTDTDGVVATAHTPTVVGSPLSRAPGDEFTAPNGLHIASNNLGQVDLTTGLGNDSALLMTTSPATNKYRVKAVFNTPSSGTVPNAWGLLFRANTSNQARYVFRRDTSLDRFRLYRHDSAGAATLLATVDGGTPTNSETWTLQVGCNEADAQDIISCRLQRNNGDYLTSGGSWSGTPQDCIAYTDGTPITSAGFGGLQIKHQTTPMVIASALAEQETPAVVPPVLTAPTGAATGNTTANAGATIDAVSGSGSRIMYVLDRVGGSPALAAAIKATGTQLAITSAGAKSVPLTGRTGGVTYSADIVYSDATTGDSNVVTSTWTQPTAPVLSAATNTPGSTTALIGATTTVSSGTAYFLARVGGSAALDTTIIATGQTSTVSTTTPSRTVTGLTASTANNFVDIVQVSGVTTSNVVSTAAFTTTSSGDTTVPTLGGSIIIGTVTSSSIQTSLSQAGADNVGVTSYEVSTNGGGSWLDIGIPGGLSYTFPGLSASTSYPLWWRAKDAAGNVSAALNATQSTAAASGVGSINLNNAIYAFKTNNGTPLASLPVTFYVSDVSTGVLVGSAITGMSTNASAILTTAISNASMLAGTTYTLRWRFSSGAIGIAELPAI